ncbi:MAG TPA: methyltransferase domain-containing protein [Spirochaetota bacterium]|nr:methyltransferase domain-containing protein [Spirochaetota bacterium]HPI87902.1 methyltransferase domain-containing protein [Spirochaetota bacterium]HPR47366.1 methyltransferase domain-containing protein [Spirochaetota bacterium]
MPDNKFNFDSMAARYDLWYQTPLGRAYDLFEKKAAAGLLPQAGPGATLLEAGSGTGHWSSWFSGKGYRVTGIDISKEMTRLAQSKNMTGCRFITGDFLRQQFSERYDVVAAITSVEFMADPEKALAIMRTLVKPGGCLFLGLLNRWSVLGLYRKLKTGNKPTYRSAHFFSMGEIRKILGKHGNPEITSAAFLLPFEKSIRFGRVLEKIGTLLFPWAGNFIICRMFV